MIINNLKSIHRTPKGTPARARARNQLNPRISALCESKQNRAALPVNADYFSSGRFCNHQHNDLTCQTGPDTEIAVCTLPAKNNCMASKQNCSKCWAFQPICHPLRCRIFISLQGHHRPVIHNKSTWKTRKHGCDMLVNPPVHRIQSCRHTTWSWAA